MLKPQRAVFEPTVSLFPVHSYAFLLNATVRIRASFINAKDLEGQAEQTDPRDRRNAFAVGRTGRISVIRQTWQSCFISVEILPAHNASEVVVPSPKLPKLNASTCAGRSR